MTPYLDADPAWKALFPKEDLEFNSRDGKVYAIPEASSQIGYFYNKELFEKAGITAPAKTWDEFFSQAEALKKAGVAAFAMDTADSGWVTSLWLNSIIGTANDAGNKWMNTMYPLDYNTPEVIDAVGKIQKMFMNYSTKDAIGGKYENAANNFFNGAAAMIANGPWMEADFSDTSKAPEGFAAKVGVAMYPNDGMFVSPVIGMFVSSKDKEHADAAVEWVKWLTNEESQSIAFETSGRTPVTPTLKISDEARKKLPLSVQCLEMSANAKYKYNYHQVLWYPNTMDVVSANYPLLGTGKMTPEEFCKVLSDEAGKNK
jgi:raffinose/stachyose/melibiose transport system substrate-binding protein